MTDLIVGKKYQTKKAGVVTVDYIGREWGQCTNDRGRELSFQLENAREQWTPYVHKIEVGSRVILKNSPNSRVASEVLALFDHDGNSWMVVQYPNYDRPEIRLVSDYVVVE